MISVITPTHNPRWLGETAASVLAQTYSDWEWVIVANHGVSVADVESTLPEVLRGDPRIKLVSWEDMRGKHAAPLGIGLVKNVSFCLAQGDIILELDHDDLLVPSALEDVTAAFQQDDVDFVYSDCIDFSPTNEPVTYHHPDRRAAWAREGWRFLTSKSEVYPQSWEPSALALARIMYAPNHLRAWRTRFYASIGGHDPSYSICDDHELLIRTYLKGRMKRIPKPLYRYRVSGENTWLRDCELIASTSERLYHQHMQALIMRECALRGGPMIDLGGAIDNPGEPWVAADLYASPSIDLTEPWPWETNSVTAFRAYDILEHLPDKLHSMSEIYRCLRPGGWLLSATPSAIGQGAFQDPTHCSYWVENSFRYYTDESLARYIRNTTERFLVGRLFTTDAPIPYVVAELCSLKSDDGSLPGARLI